MQSKQSTRGIKRLEVTMRDVLDGLEDAAVYMNYHSRSDIVEVLSIEPPGRPIVVKQNIVQLKTSREDTQNSNIVDYLIQRELKKSA